MMIATGHEGVHGQVVMIDRGMVGTVLWMNSLAGVRTHYCCEGGRVHRPYVMFSCCSEASLDSVAKRGAAIANYGRCEVKHHPSGEIRYTIRFGSRPRFARWKHNEGLI